MSDRRAFRLYQSQAASHAGVVESSTYGATPRFESLETLSDHLNRDEVRTRVKQAVASTGTDRAVVGVPGELLFDDPRGDCHVKYGYLQDEAHFVVKVATGFSGNAARGLPVSGGVVLLFSRRSGALQAVLHDAGQLTSWRTAAAGALASRALARPDARRIAVLGTGEQAELQAVWHADVFPGVPIVVAGRDAGRTRRLADALGRAGLGVDVSTIPEAVGAADIIVTATSATAPLFPADLVEPGTHITSVGSDGPGKQELDPILLARSDLIATDDHQQCLRGGELGNAVRAGAVSDSADIPLGTVFRSAPRTRSSDAITVADLTGLTVEDLAIASFFRERLGLPE